MKDHPYHHQSHENHASLNKVAFMATLKFQSACAIGEITDMAIGTALSWSSLAASLAIPGAAVFPLNRWLISKGQTLALAHVRYCGG